MIGVNRGLYDDVRPAMYTSCILDSVHKNSSCRPPSPYLCFTVQLFPLRQKSSRTCMYVSQFKSISEPT